MISTLLVSPAFAQAAGAAAQPSPFAGLVPILLVVMIFYFLIIRPQSRKMKEHQAMLASVKKGDEVVTGGGVYGKVVSVTEGKVKVSIADNVEITVDQPTIARVVNYQPVLKPVQANDNNKKAAKK